VLFIFLIERKLSLIFGIFSIFSCYLFWGSATYSRVYFYLINLAFIKLQTSFRQVKQRIIPSCPLRLNQPHPKGGLKASGFSGLYFPECLSPASLYTLVFVDVDPEKLELRIGKIILKFSLINLHLRSTLGWAPGLT